MMYSTVPPPEQSIPDSTIDKEKEDPPRGISEETWKVISQR